MLRSLTCLAAAALPALLHAQPAEAWQACTSLKDNAQRLACFDDWAKARAPVAPAVPAEAVQAPERAIVDDEPPRRGVRLTSREGCHDPKFSTLTRFWELEQGADCGTFGIRGYRPISVDLATANNVNRQPTSENPVNSATTQTDYRNTEVRLNLSVRTKIAQGLLKYGDEGLDSLWVAYSQQSYWQLFTPSLSRPFRSTDHEPELLYVHPLQSAQPGNWRLRLGGLGLVHQSNGQSDPLSRSWNRVFVMAAAERDGLQVTGRLWRRLDETGEDNNPAISDYIGRGELAVRWEMNRRNLFVFTGRHALRRDGHGSVRFEWFRTLADTGWGLPSGLRLHTQLFSGYGDTLLDYNHARTVFSIGLSLVEW